MLRFTTISVLIGLALTANAEEPLAFKGFRIGADRAAFLATFPGSDCTVDECHWPHERLCPPDYERCFTHERWKYGPTRPLWAVAQFRGDRLASVIFNFPTRDFEQLSEALVARFGPPHKDERDVIQNRMGATFDNRTVAWESTDAVIRVSKRSGNIDEGSVVFTGKEHLEQLEADRRRAAKAHAKEL